MTVRFLLLTSFSKGSVIRFQIRTLKVKTGKKVSYTQTVQLPQTKFPSWMSSKKRVELDDHIRKVCGFEELYSWQRNNLKGEEFILHDGPPYANGLPHMGHAINKVLKDIITRRKLLEGKCVDYRPGWDCHGLPIELKVLLESNKSNPIDIRNKARKVAEQAIEDQKEIFKSWGVMADWNSYCYHTFDTSYIKNQLMQFYLLFKKGLIYRELKPVFWSPSSKTALAEAELEYNSNHKSTAVTVKLKLSKKPSCLEKFTNDVYILIWTTTPWTLPANQAVAYSSDLDYTLVSFNNSKEKFIVAKSLVDTLAKKLNSKTEIIAEFSGMELNGAKYYHPFSKEELPLLSGVHVTADMGTGLVHTAPAHGQDDFILALKNNIIVKCAVDENGKYTSDVGEDLKSLPVLEEGNNKVIGLIKEDIIHKEVITHSYPYDWRSKKPIILRASKQWFIDTAEIKDRAVEAAKSIPVFPNRNMGGLISQVERRPYWCISRQRVWGVPIPVIYDKEDRPIITKKLLDVYLELLDSKGPNFWWTMSPSEMIPSSLANELNVDIGTLRKGQDILDIWFDSGLSWSYILNDKVADLYLEGIDQFTGWFQSSLLTSVALKDRAPYKALFVHGFAVDEEGRKMSKSIGNVIDPQDIIRGGYDVKKQPAFGIDALRWWVAAHGTQHANVPVSFAMLNNSSDSLKKLRNLIKFLLGSISDMPTSSSPVLLNIDHYMLHKLSAYVNEVTGLYETYQFNKISMALMNFIVYISGFYCHSVKDRLYCDEPNSPKRRAAQYTLLKLLEGLTLSFAPILPVLAEEVYLHHPHNIDNIPFFHRHHSKIVNVESIKNEEEVSHIVETALKVKEEVIKETPVNCSNWQLSCTISAGSQIYNALKELQTERKSSSSELAEIIQVSEVELLAFKEGCSTQEGFQVEVKHTNQFLCDRCRKFTSMIDGEPCLRCNEVLEMIVK